MASENVLKEENSVRICISCATSQGERIVGVSVGTDFRFVACEDVLIVKDSIRIYIQSVTSVNVLTV